MLRYARALLGGDCAEDACQEAWIRAWNAWGSTRDEALDAWMTGLVRTCCQERRRRASVVAPLAADERLPTRSFEDESLAAVSVHGLWSILAGMPPALREVLFLRGVLDLSYAEIADLQGVPMGTVMSRLYQARRRARNRLANSRKMDGGPPSCRLPA